MKSVIRTSALFVSLAMILAGCSGASEETATSAKPTPSESEIKIPPVWSLTGLPGPDDAQDQPIVVVKIENDPVVRPQTGLDRADLIFEELVEGGMTRFAVVFQSDLPDEVGPVRSVRHVDVAIAEPIADAFIFSGGAKRTMRFVGRKLPTTISVVTEGGPGMYRKSGLYAPHNLFLNMNEMLQSLAEHDTPSSGFFVRPEPSATPTTSQAPSPEVSESASGVGTASPTTKPFSTVSKVAVKFSSFAGPNWEWNPTDKLWMRSEGKKPFKNVDGTQFGTNNLVIVEVREIDAGYKGSTGGYVPRTVLTGSGRAWVLSNGGATEVAWRKPFVNAQMELTDTSGRPFTMPTGRTWVELLPVVTTGEYAFDGVDVPMGNPPLPANDPAETDTP